MWIGIFLLAISLHAGATEILKPNNVEHLLADKPRLIVLWSLDCPPCYKELAMLQQLLLNHPKLPINLIATDDDSSRYPEVESMHQQLVGEHLDKWVYADLLGSQLRYAIDPTWSGVLPRSYFVEADGKRAGHSGVLTPEHVLTWFLHTQK